MDVRYEMNGALFVRDERKARSNVSKHHVTFEQAAEVFFDPLFTLVDSARNDEARDAVVGYDCARHAALYRSRSGRGRPDPHNFRSQGHPSGAK